MDDFGRIEALLPFRQAGRLTGQASRLCYPHPTGTRRVFLANGPARLTRCIASISCGPDASGDGAASNARGCAARARHFHKNCWSLNLD